MLRTSLNIHLDILARIDAAAVYLKLSHRAIIVRLFMRVVRDYRRYPGGFTLVKYQKADPEKRWHCFPICYSKKENEVVTDLRKLGKFSASRFLAIAVHRYLDELVREIEEGVLNYDEPLTWSLGLKRVDGSLCWEIYWGKPKPGEKTNQPGVLLRSTG
jgi:hypothetical protein